MKGYYLTYNSGCGVVAFTSVNDCPWYNPYSIPKIFGTRKEAHNALKLTLLHYGMTRQAAKRFNIVPVTSDTSYIKNI